MPAASAPAPVTKPAVVTAPAQAVAQAAPPGAAAAAPARADGTEGPFDCYAVLDFEATCDDGQRMDPQEVIEFPIVLVDATKREVVDEFRTYVRPERHQRLSRFCTELTGIVQAAVDSAPVWTVALRQAEEWLDAQLAGRGFRRCVFVTCGDWDLKTMMPGQCAVVGQQVPRRFRYWLNIKNLFRTVTTKHGKGMKEMLTELGLPLDGRHHSGLDDSRNIAKILLSLLGRGGVVDESTLSWSTGGGAGKGGAPARSSACAGKKGSGRGG